MKNQQLNSPSSKYLEEQKIYWNKTLTKLNSCTRYDLKRIRNINKRAETDFLKLVAGELDIFIIAIKERLKNDQIYLEISEKHPALLNIIFGLGISTKVRLEGLPIIRAIKDSRVIKDSISELDRSMRYLKKAENILSNLSINRIPIQIDKLHRKVEEIRNKYDGISKQKWPILRNIQDSSGRIQEANLINHTLTNMYKVMKVKIDFKKASKRRSPIRFLCVIATYFAFSRTNGDPFYPEDLRNLNKCK